MVLMGDLLCKIVVNRMPFGRKGEEEESPYRTARSTKAGEVVLSQKVRGCLLMKKEMEGWKGSELAVK